MLWREKVLKDVFDDFFPGEKPKAVIDIGGGESEVKKTLNPEKYVNVNMENYTGEKGVHEIGEAKPDYVCNLNTVERIDFPDGSFDCVVLSQILEHLDWDAHYRVIAEAMRLSSKWVIVGLPNDISYESRIRTLLGKPTIDVSQYGHHYQFNVTSAGNFVKERFGTKFPIVKKKLVVRGPLKLVSGIAKMRENFFAGEVYYLLQKQE